MPMFRRASRSALPLSAVISLPSTITRPLVGVSSRFTQRTSVLLPAPERPMIPNISPLLYAERDVVQRVDGTLALAEGLGEML